MLGKILHAVKEHAAFILTMFVTYALGLILVAMQYVATDGFKNIFKVLIDSMVPTTITYVLGCVMVNMVEAEDDARLLNIFACALVFMYAMVFCMYLMTGLSFFWIVTESCITLALILLNILCYREKFKQRNHGIA